MTVHSIYLDFFRFLDDWQSGDPWDFYRCLYFQPHGKFLRAYWETFHHFDLAQIAERVRQIKKEDYGHLRSLVRSQDPTLLAKEALERCQKIRALDPSPPVYLFVGFFSADGVTVDVDGIPSIALGLERFPDFKDLPLLISHEYGHCAQRSVLRDFLPREERNLLHALVAEGLSVLFSQMAYPDIPLHRHLFLTPERLRWGQENQDVLLKLVGADLATDKLIPVLFGPGDPNAGLPPRMGYFLARQMVGQCLSHHGAEEFGKIFPGFEEFFRKILEGKIFSPESQEG